MPNCPTSFSKSLCLTKWSFCHTTFAPSRLAACIIFLWDFETDESIMMTWEPLRILGNTAHRIRRGVTASLLPERPLGAQKYRSRDEQDVVCMSKSGRTTCMSLESSEERTLRFSALDWGLSATSFTVLSCLDLVRKKNNAGNLLPCRNFGSTARPL